MNAPLRTNRQGHLADLSERFNRLTPSSKARADLDRPVFADKSSIGLRFAAETKEICYPVVVDRAEGASLHDIDGNRYVDILQGLGVNLFGHNPVCVREALARQIAQGFPIGPQSPLVGDVARLVTELTGVERLCFSNTGTEAVMTAIRVARAATGRPCVAIFTNSYHGHHDVGLMRAPLRQYARKRVIERAEHKPWLRPLARLLDKGMSVGAVPAFPGVSAATARDVIVLEYGHPASLDVLRRRARDIAAVLVEPVQSRCTELQPADFLHDLRALTRATGTVLVFDEMVTGFRVAAGGAQAHFGIQADLVTYSKIVGGGLPLSVLGGRAELMARIDGGTWRFGDDSAPATPTTFFAGTFTKHPLSLAAAHAVLTRIRDEGPGLYQRLNTATAALVARLNGWCAGQGVPLQFTHFGSFFTLANSRSRLPDDVRPLLAYHLLLRGVHLRIGDAGGFLCSEHTDADIEHIANAFTDSLGALRADGLI